MPAQHCPSLALGPVSLPSKALHFYIRGGGTYSVARCVRKASSVPVCAFIQTSLNEVNPCPFSSRSQYTSSMTRPPPSRCLHFADGIAPRRHANTTYRSTVTNRSLHSTFHVFANGSTRRPTVCHLSTSTRASQSRIHSPTRRMDKSSSTTYAVVDRVFDFRPRVDLLLETP